MPSWLAEPTNGRVKVIGKHQQLLETPEGLGCCECCAPCRYLPKCLQETNLHCCTKQGTAF